jgi:hypothetical protein
MEKERGEVRLSSLVMLVLFAAAGLAAWNVIPIYYANYSFSDKMVEVCRRPKYNNSDDEILKALEKEARALDLQDYINARTCRVQTSDFRRRLEAHVPVPQRGGPASALGRPAQASGSCASRSAAAARSASARVRAG